jgi:guanylate kinase
VGRGQPSVPGRLFVVSGPSGAGKGTVWRAALERLGDIEVSVSATTRRPRPGERDQAHYLFMSPEEFSARRDRGEFLEWAEVYGNLYGTPSAPVDAALAAGRDVLMELDTQGALQVKRARPEAILIFIEPPSLEELVRRLERRGTEDAESVSRRVQASYQEVKQKVVYDHAVVNDDLDAAIDQLVRILETTDGKG